METSLTPLEFARRSRKLYGDREAVVDGDLRLTYEQFFDRCDRWSAALQGIGVKKGDRVAYIATHSGAKVLCVHPDYLDAIDGVRSQLSGVEHFVSLGSTGGRKGWSEYEAAIATAKPDFKHTDIAESDLLPITSTSGTAAKPKGVMITHRNAWANAVGTLVHFPL